MWRRSWGRLGRPHSPLPHGATRRKSLALGRPSAVLGPVGTERRGGAGGTVARLRGTVTAARLAWRLRRQLPDGWQLHQSAAPALVDAIVEQTRELAHMLFAASIAGRDVPWHRDPARARQAWLDAALVRRDGPLCSMIERMDGETFSATWAALARRLDARGAPDVLDWIERRGVFR